MRLALRLSLAAVVALPSCADDHVRNEATPTWKAEHVARAGAVDGRGSLSSVFHVEVGPGGEILVAQASPPGIAVFDSTGTYLRTVGRSGGGPGEFRSLGRIGWTGDTLWAIEPGRLHLFDSDLRFARTITPIVPDAPIPRMRIFPGPLLADGSILGIPASFGGAQPVPEPIMLLAQDGSLRRVLAEVSPEGKVAELDVGRSRPVRVQHPWADAPLWTVEPEGRSVLIVERRAAVAAERAAFRLVRIGLDGDTLLDRAVPYAPMPVGAAARERVYRRLVERFAGDEGSGDTAAEVERRIRSELETPPFHPPVTGLVVGRDGTLWLRREQPEADSVDWQVLDQEGDELGRVRLPSDLTVYTAERRRLWGLSRDSLDVPFVEVYRLVTPP